MQRDIFDILDVPFREDSYSGLIVEVLRRSQPIAAGVFAALTGERPTDEPEILFRKNLEGCSSKLKPDIVIRTQTASGPWWLVFEAKIKSGEGEEQTYRYRKACERARVDGRCAGYSLFYLTPDGIHPSDAAWNALTIANLAEKIESLDEDGITRDDPHIAPLWRDFAARLRHHAEYPRPKEDDSILGYLLQSADEGFVDRDVRAIRLGSALVPTSYENQAIVYVGRGREQFLLKAWKPSWLTNTWTKDGPDNLEDCVSVHYELDVPIPYKRTKVTCHLHCESSPYKTKREIEQLGDRAGRFLGFVDAFTKALHSELRGTNWTPANKVLQKAKLTCPLDMYTTVKQLHHFLISRFDGAQPAVSKAMIVAAKECGLGWWSTVV